MPYRKPKRSYVLPVVTTLAVAAPLATFTLSDSTDYRSTTGSDLAAIPTQLAEVMLTTAPDITLPLRELTGLDLPDLHLSDLRMLPLPASIPLPEGLPLPPGVELPREIPLPDFNSGQTPGRTAPGQSLPGQSIPSTPGQTAPAQPIPGRAPAAQFIADPSESEPGITPDTPALAPGAVPPELLNQVGAQVKELSRDTPFSVVALTARDLVNTKAMVRARQSDGTWGQWYDTEPVDTRRTDSAPADGPTGTEPIYVGNTNAVQILVTRKPAISTAVQPGAVQPGAAQPGATQPGATQPGTAQPGTAQPGTAQPGTAQPGTAQPGATQPGATQAGATQAGTAQPRAVQSGAAQPGTVQPGTVETGALQPGTMQPGTMLEEGAAPVQPIPAAAPHSDDPAQLNTAELTAVLIDPGRGAIDDALSDVAAALPGGGPHVITRSQWGADESIRCEEPTYDDELGGITVHHTAGRNDYSKAESAGIVRAIYAYHAKTLGWCDIGYNALVDKYGQIFEGRFGGLDRPVQGAHAGGFNENTAGVALMGNYESEDPSDEAIDATGQFVGWRSKVAGLDPHGNTTMYSEGTQFTPYAQGEAVKLPVVFAHRDVGNTSCPGDAAYSEMDRIRDIAAGATGGTIAKPQQQPQPQQPQQRQPSAPRTQSDLAELAALTTKLLGMVNQNPIAKHWADKGGPDGPLGAAESEPMPTAQGQQYAKFVNGYVYTGTDGQVYEVLGTILDRFVALGADAGVLGLPTSNTYPIPDGLRSDFQYGSLVLNQLTGIVTTVWKTYNDTYQQQIGRNSAGQAAPGPISTTAPTTGATPDPAPVQAPLPELAPAPVQPSPSPVPTTTEAPTPGN